jgi:hypothetical protein
MDQNRQVEELLGAACFKKEEFWHDCELLPLLISFLYRELLLKIIFS